MQHGQLAGLEHGHERRQVREDEGCDFSGSVHAFQVICDGRINPPESLENGIVNAKVFVTPVPTLERIQIDLIRVAIGKMQQELDIQGLGQSNQ